MTSAMVSAGYGAAQKQLKADPELLLKPSQTDPGADLKSAEAYLDVGSHLKRKDAVKKSLLNSEFPPFPTYL